MKSFMIDAAVKFFTFYPGTRINVFCEVTEGLVIPERIMSQYPLGSQIMFVINESSAGVDFDFDTEELSWSTTFGGSPFLLQIPLDSIRAISTEDNSAVQFHVGSPDGKPQQEPLKPSKPKKPELSLASYSPEVTPEKSKAELSIVKKD